MPVLAITRDPVTAEFFAGTARRQLLIRRCDTCGTHNSPAVGSCDRCGNAVLQWTPAAGDGAVVSWSVVHTPARRTPVAIVELDEGPWLHAQLVDVDPDTVTAGLRVRVAFEQPDDGEAIPVFRPLT